MKKIVIDARMIGVEHAGIGRFVENFVRQINPPAGGEKLKMKNLDFSLLVRPKKLQDIKEEFGSKFHYFSVNAPHYSLQEQILVPLKLLSIKPDLVHFPHFNVPLFCPFPFIVTIYDLTKHHFRGKETTTRNQVIYWLKYCLYRFVFWWTVKRALKIITLSQAVKDELIKHYHLPEKKIVVIYGGVGEKFKVKNPRPRLRLAEGGQKSKIPGLAFGLPRAGKSQKLLNKYKIKKPFLIYTGSLYPHKNIIRLIQSIKLLNQKAISHKPLVVSLVIVCSRNVFWERMEKKIKALKGKDDVKMIGFVPDEELVLLYQEAAAFAQPSLMEGFDLPVLEAMAAGLPCLISDIPVHREIYQDIPGYFDPLKPTAISQKIAHVLEYYNTTEYCSKRKAGVELAQKFTWQKTAQKTLKVYQEVLDRNYI